MYNHISINLVTKGLLNISNITKGMILISGYEIVLRRRGGSPPHVPRVPLHYDEKEKLFYEINQYEQEDIELIKVYVNWQESPTKGYKKMEAQLLKAHIEAEILQETNKHVQVQIIS